MASCGVLRATGLAEKLRAVLRPVSGVAPELPAAVLDRVTLRSSSHSYELARFDGPREQEEY